MGKITLDVCVKSTLMFKNPANRVVYASLRVLYILEYLTWNGLESLTQTKLFKFNHGPTVPELTQLRTQSRRFLGEPFQAGSAVLLGLCLQADLWTKRKLEFVSISVFFHTKSEYLPCYKTRKVNTFRTMKHGKWTLSILWNTES